MRLSELAHKELVNLVDGSKRGPFLKLDFLIDLDKGTLVTMLLPGKGFITRQGQEIPWTAVKKISTDLILFEDESWADQE